MSFAGENKPLAWITGDFVQTSRRFAPHWRVRALTRVLESF
jgi:hypothetical protein